MLDKHRIIAPREGENNFHIFYQMCEGVDDSTRKTLNLESSYKKYKILAGTDRVLKGTSDKEQFKQTENAMIEAGISIHERLDIYKVLAAILHLGNLQFKKLEFFKVDDSKQSAEISNLNVLKSAADCLDVPEEILKQCLLCKSIQIEESGKIVQQPVSPTAADENRNTMAILLYDRLWNWLIRRLNTAVKPASNEERFTLGILDMCGHENYEQNSFEQLNINYVDEQIQSFILKGLFEEQNQYVQEDVPWKFKNVDMSSAEESLRVIGGSIGIYSLLEENVTDESLMNNMIQNFHEKSTSFEKHKNSQCFSLNHFHSKVLYCINGWTMKNRDSVDDDLLLTVQKSKSSLLQQLFPKDEVKKKRFDKEDTLLATDFVSDVKELLSNLNGKKYLYVNCIKPNVNKKSDDLNDSLLLDQVSYYSISSTLIVRKPGYYFAMPYDKFLERYRVCSDQTWPRWRGLPKTGCQEILKELQVSNALYALGKTQLFLRSPITIANLEEKVDSKKMGMAQIIQRGFIKYKVRKTVLEKRQLEKALRATFADGEYTYTQMVNYINIHAERERRLFVLTKSAIYLVNAKSYTVLRKLSFDKISRVCCSSLNDGLFYVQYPSSVDCLLEADNKYHVLGVIREAFFIYIKIYLEIEIKE
jgi:myosin-1